MSYHQKHQPDQQSLPAAPIRTRGLPVDRLSAAARRLSTASG
jgi:hypothetical protein